jgi:tRNA G18 (ribose-2'-O)-methylase SpoU
MRKLKMEELGRLSPEQMRLRHKMPVILVLDNIRSALNVGAAFRTADAFALEKIYLCGITATPPHREILKTALGAHESVSWEYAEEACGVVDQLKSAGWQVLAVEQAEGSIPLHEFGVESSGRYALVFGNEVNGVGDPVMQTVDACLEIPQFGTKHSLNVSVSVGIVAWQLVCRLLESGLGSISNKTS